SIRGVGKDRLLRRIGECGARHRVLSSSAAVLLLLSVEVLRGFRTQWRMPPPLANEPSMQFEGTCMGRKSHGAVGRTISLVSDKGCPRTIAQSAALLGRISRAPCGNCLLRQCG